MSKTKQGPPVSFRSVEIERELRARGEELGQVAKRDLEWLYKSLRQELTDMRLTEAEASLICEANDPRAEDLQDRFWVNVADRPDLAQKWHIAIEPFTTKLRALTRLQRRAIGDAVQRFWRLPADGDPGERLVQVGLLSRQLFEWRVAGTRVIAAHKALRIAEARGQGVETARQEYDAAEATMSDSEEAIKGSAA